jgi:hypothetical protein
VDKKFAKGDYVLNIVELPFIHLKTLLAECMAIILSAGNKGFSRLNLW